MKCSICKRPVVQPMCPFCVRLTNEFHVAMVRYGDEVKLFKSRADADAFAYYLPGSVVSWEEVRPVGREEEAGALVAGA